MTEEWRGVVGHENRYRVSNRGQVVGPSGKVLAQYFSPAGYHLVSVERRNVPVHRLVTAAFLGPRPNGAVTRHLDGSRSNNWVSNLAYGTHKENHDDSVSHGTFVGDKNLRRGVDRVEARVQCGNGHALVPYEGPRTDRKRWCPICTKADAAAWQRRFRARNK